MAEGSWPGNRVVMRRGLLMLALGIQIALLLAGPVAGQGDQQRNLPGDGPWVAPYPQLPQYRERLGRLLAEGPPAGGPAPDITSRGIVAVGTFMPPSESGRAAPGGMIAAYASLTFSRDFNGRPNFDDLRGIVRDVTEVRVAPRSATGTLQRRTGTPAPSFQPCVEREIVRRAFQLDARWQAIAACADSLSWSDWTADPELASLLPAPMTPAPGYRWLQPYPELPEYREYTGRLLGDAAAANADARFANVTVPAVLAVGAFKARATPDETVASYGVQFFNLDLDNRPVPPDLRLVFNDLTEVRFSLAGTRGVNLDVRKGALTYRYQQCVDRSLPWLMYLPDARRRAMVECQHEVTWGPWSTTPPRPFSGTFPADAVTTFDYAWDAAAGELRLALR